MFPLLPPFGVVFLLSVLPRFQLDAIEDDRNRLEKSSQPEGGEERAQRWPPWRRRGAPVATSATAAVVAGDCFVLLAVFLPALLSRLLFCLYQATTRRRAVATVQPPFLPEKTYTMARTATVNAAPGDGCRDMSSKVGGNERLNQRPAEGWSRMK